MTNLLLTLILTTNWTGITLQNKEIGIVMTNHIVSITYNNTNHQFTLLTELSNIAVYRDQRLSITNNWYNHITNNAHQYFDVRPFNDSH